MSKYNVTKFKPTPLRLSNGVQRSYSRNLIVQKPSKVQPVSTTSKPTKLSLWDKVGTYKAVTWKYLKVCVRASHLNMTLVYQGHVVSKFATSARESGAVRHD